LRQLYQSATKDDISSFNAFLYDVMNNIDKGSAFAEVFFDLGLFFVDLDNRWKIINKSARQALFPYYADALQSKLSPVNSFEVWTSTPFQHFLIFIFLCGFRVTL